MYLYIRLRGATVARLTPDQKVACSNHVGVTAKNFGNHLLRQLLGTGFVVKTACLESRRSWARTPLALSFKETKVILGSLVKIQYCGDPPSPKGCVLGLRLLGI